MIAQSLTSILIPEEVILQYQSKWFKLIYLLLVSLLQYSIPRQAGKHPVGTSHCRMDFYFGQVWCFWFVSLYNILLWALSGFVALFQSKHKSFSFYVIDSLLIWSFVISQCNMTFSPMSSLALNSEKHGHKLGACMPSQWSVPLTATPGLLAQAPSVHGNFQVRILE